MWLSPRSGVFTPEEAFPLGTTCHFAVRAGLANAGWLAFGGRIDATVTTPPFGIKGFASPGYMKAADASAQPALNVLFNADVPAEAAAAGW